MPVARRSSVLPFLLLALLAGGCAARSTPATTRALDGASSPLATATPAATPAPAVERPAPPVPAIDTEPVFKSLQPPTVEGSAPYHFKEIRTPARPNEEQAVFPPAAELTPPKPATPEAGPLAVSRHQPEGLQQIVGSVNVTFNQPMVPLASLEDLKNHPVPLELEPLPPGRFRWLGTSTVEFEPEGRLPFATSYTAHVAAGTKSELGAPLAKELRWTFETPRPTVTFSPSNGFREAVPNQLITLTFNQAVTSDAVLKALQCSAGLLHPIALVASEPETNPFKDDTAPDAAVQRKLYLERNVFFRPVGPLPLDTEITCNLAKGFRSAEGPLPMMVDQSASFRTYAPLKLEDFRCGWGDQCRAEGGLTARFNNALVDDQELKPLVHVEPAVADLNITAYGNNLVLQGGFQPSTKYRVRIDAGLEDAHQQKLAAAVTKEFTFQESDPSLEIAGAPLTIVEAVGQRVLPVHATNISNATLRWFNLEPEQVLPESNRYEPSKNAGLKLGGTRTVKLGAHDNTSGAKGIDLGSLLGTSKYGLLLVDLEAPEMAKLYSGAEVHQRAVVQVTDLGLTAHLTDESAIVLVTSLSTGKPIADAKVSLLAGSKSLAVGTTDANGIAALPGPAKLKMSGQLLNLAAQLGEDRSVLPLNDVRVGSYVSSYLNGSLNAHAPSLVSSVFTDRDPYKPGETVHVAGVLRVATHGVKGGIEPLPAGARLKYTVHDDHGMETHKGTISVGPLGMFSVDLKIAPDAFLGSNQFEGVLENAGKLSGSVATSFQVLEFRTPEYKVSIDAGDARHFVGETLHAKVKGEYFFGGPMSGANVSWSITRAKGSFTPPGATGYTFGEGGEIHPDMDWERGRSFRDRAIGAAVANGTGTLDGSGLLAIDVPLAPGDIKGAVSFQIEASVTDANRQQISANSTVLAHAGAWYPGLKIDHGVVKEGESVEISALTADVDGNRHEAPTSVELAEKTWERVKKKGGWSYEEKEAPLDGCSLSRPKTLDEPATCRLKIPKAGNFVVRVRAKDDRGRENVSSLVVWAYGKGWTPWYRNSEQAALELVSDKPEHAPGETANLLIRSPFPRSVGLLAVEREGLVEYRSLNFEGAAHGEAIALTEAELPNVTVTVSLVRGRISPSEAGALPDDPDDAGRPMYAGGSLVLPISKKGHAVTVAVKADAEAIEPGAKLGFQVRTTDSDSHPVSARLAIAVVDEGVLSLLGYSMPNPLEAIFAARAGEGSHVSAVPLVLPREPNLRDAPRFAATIFTVGKGTRRAPMSKSAEGDAGGAMLMSMSADYSAARVPGSMAAMANQPAPTMTARTFFASTAYFTADARTDSNGILHLSVPMPESLTRYRIMVVAVGNQDRCGEGDDAVQVRKPILVRPSLPRFLNLGDKFLASAVVNNQTAQDLWVDVQARAANGTTDAKRQRVLVRAGLAQEVAFEASAGVPGNSRWQFAAVALSPERWNDAAELDVPVQLPATVEGFATYGSTDKSVLQPLQLPKNALPDFGGLEVSMSSTALTSLTDAVTYLSDYPYECVEQTASRILPYIVLRKVIAEFHLKGTGTQEQRDKLIKEGVERIWAKQRPDGGFGYWADSRESYLFISSWAAYVLARAEAAGYPSDTYRHQQLMTFLTQRLRNPRRDLYEDTDYNSQAMAALVLSSSGATIDADIQRIYRERTHLAIFGKAWLMEAAHLSRGQDGAIEQELNREIQSAAVEKASSAHFAEATGESVRLIMHSNERTDAIVLDTFLHVRPNDPLIPKIIHGLNESRSHGRWDTTQSNAWGTVAMTDYYDLFEKETPDFNANLFVGNGFVGQGKFAGRETKILTDKVPFSALAEETTSDLILEKQGTGRLYYRLGLRYAPKDLKLAAEEQGFTVTRTYLPMADAPGSVFTDADGSIRIQAGADVRVKLEIVVPDRAEFVAVDDPLPAGLEATNTAFLTSQSSRVVNAQSDDISQGRGWWGWWSPFNHTELRDDRVVLFSDQLSAGVYTHTYVARATTKGTFQVPPTRAFEMYEPENFGRTASTVVVVQ